MTAVPSRTVRERRAWPRRKNASSCARIAPSRRGPTPGRRLSAARPRADETGPAGERVRAKGDLSRKRTIMTDATGVQAGGGAGDSSCPRWTRQRTCPAACCASTASTASSRPTTAGSCRCNVRRLLKSLATDERSIVTTGDRVWIRPVAERRGLHRARRAAARPADARLPRPRARPRRQRRSGRHRHVAGRAGPEAAPDRPLPRQRRAGRHPPDRLPEQGRPRRRRRRTSRSSASTASSASRRS